MRFKGAGFFRDTQAVEGVFEALVDVLEDIVIIDPDPENIHIPSASEFAAAFEGELERPCNKIRTGQFFIDHLVLGFRDFADKFKGNVEVFRICPFNRGGKFFKGF